MPQAQFVNDGDFSTAAQNGNWTFKYPFASKGDFVSYVASRKMRADTFAPPVAMTPRSFSGRNTAYFANVGDAETVDGSLLEWTEEWASVPETRVEFGSDTYTQLVAVSGAGGSIVVGSVSYSAIVSVMDSATVYQYGRITLPVDTSFILPPSTGYIQPWPNTVLPTLYAPRYVAVDGRVFLYGNPAQIVAQSGVILANDSSSSIYMGGILERVSKYVNRTTPQQIS